MYIQCIKRCRNSNIVICEMGRVEVHLTYLNYSFFYSLAEVYMLCSNRYYLILCLELRGLEPLTSCMPCKHSSQLSYSPMSKFYKILLAEVKVF